MPRNPLLTKAEKANLGRQRNEAFKYLDDLELIHETGDTKTERQKKWAKNQLQEHFGIDSLTKARRNQFRAIKAHFQELAGDISGAMSNQLKTGKVKDHGDDYDTHENRELWHTKIKRHLAEHQARCAVPGEAGSNAARAGGSLGMGYIISIARNKFRKPASWADLTTLTAFELRDLFFTTKTRIAKREGR